MAADNETVRNPPSRPDPAAGRRARERKGKMILLGAFLLAGAGLYATRLMPPAMPKGFLTDLPAARKLARQEVRPLLVLFWAPRVEADATRFVLGEKGLREGSVNRAIEKGGFVCAGVKLDRDFKNSELAKKYNITRVPTLVVFRSMGSELDRLEGRFGHAKMEDMLSQAALKAG